MKKINILVQLVADEKYTQAIQVEIPKLVESMQVAEGCISASVYQTVDDPNTFYILQNWITEIHWAKHNSSQVVKDFSNQFRGGFHQAVITQLNEL